MKKFTLFLEKYVQWIALGVAAIYVGLMVYSYIFTDPLTEKLGTTAVLPGTIDQEILAKQITPLEKDINNHTVNAPAVTDVLTTLKVALNEDNLQVGPMLATIAAPSVAPDLLGPDIQKDNITKVAEPFPLLPTPVVKALSTGRTVINVADARQDIAYTSILFTVDRAKFLTVANWCSNKDIPPGLFVGPEFAQVELLRQELSADGVSWTAARVIKGLPVNELLAFPGDECKPGNEQVFFVYRDWMEKNQDLITQPAFYPTAPDAEPWMAPGAAPLAGAVAPGQPMVAERPFDPARDIPKTDEQRRQLAEYKRQQALQRRLSNPGTGRYGRPGPGSLYTPPPPQLPPPYSPATTSGRPTGLPNGLPQQPGVMPPFGVGANGANGLLQGDPQILVHDTTIEEGKTYRYTVRYKIYNPLFHTPAYASASVAQKFALSSPDPALDKDPKSVAWTDKVNIDPSTHFGVTHISELSHPAATFDVFTWKDGRWRKSTTTKLSPGDAILSGKDDTHWTVVDIRKDLHINQSYVILMDPNGVLQARNVENDKDSAEIKKLNDQVSANPGPAAAAQ